MGGSFLYPTPTVFSGGGYNPPLIYTSGDEEIFLEVFLVIFEASELLENLGRKV